MINRPDNASHEYAHLLGQAARHQKLTAHKQQQPRTCASASDATDSVEVGHDGIKLTFPSSDQHVGGRCMGLLAGYNCVLYLLSVLAAYNTLSLPFHLWTALSFFGVVTSALVFGYYHKRMTGCTGDCCQNTLTGVLDYAYVTVLFIGFCMFASNCLFVELYTLDRDYMNELGVRFPRTDSPWSYIEHVTWTILQSVQSLFLATCLHLASRRYVTTRECLSKPKSH